MKVRKLLCLLFVCGLLVAALSARAVAAEGSCGAGLSWNLDENGTLTVSGTGQMDDWYSDSMPWASYKKLVTAVVIEDGVTGIGTSAFEGFTKLQKVTIGKDVAHIGSHAFEGCTGLTQVHISDVAAWCGITFEDFTNNPIYYAKALYINDRPVSGALTIPEGVTQIPAYAFYYCAGITSVTLPDSVETVDNSAFAHCEGLERLQLGAGLKTVGNAAFAYCTALQTVQFGSSIVEIGDNAFYRCVGLTEADLPKDLEKIGQRAFEECTALHTVNFPEGLTQIGTYGFYGCGALTEVTLPDSITTIGDYTFYGCAGMKTLHIPDTVTAIGKHAFHGCVGLTELTIPEGIVAMGSYAFQNCTGLTKLQFNAVNMNDLSSSNYVFYKAGQNGPGITLTTGPKVKKIPAYLFFPYSSATYAPKLASVEFSQSVELVGKYAFAYCKSLTALYFTGAAPTIGDNAFNKMTATVFYPETDSSWAGAGNYGGTITWQPYSALLETEDGTVYPSVELALKSGSGWLRLRTDAHAGGVLTKDLYVDLNGYDLTGTMALNGYSVYGLDSAADGYICDGVGYFNCVDENGRQITPVTHCKYGTKRYLSIKSEEGFSFHRFYLGITHMTLKPNTDGVGYKAVFCGDEQVRRQLDSYGYTLQLGNFTPKTVYKSADDFVSGKTLTLRIDNFDPEKYGETHLYAGVFLKLKDGTVIESSTCTMTLRGLAEQLNEKADDLTPIQKQAIAAMIARHKIMETWKTENLLQ